MNYYPFNISDFGYATRHLSLTEKAVYRELLDLYYDQESPLENNPQKLARLICAPDNSTDVEQVLNEFFSLEGDVWINSTCDRIIKEYHDKLEKASKAGKASARARAKKSKGCKDSTDVEQTLNECSTNQEPRTKNHKPERVIIPYQEFARAYNENFADNVDGREHIAGLSDTRKKAIKKLWTYSTDCADNKRTDNVEYWERYFSYCSKVPFLNGESGKFKAGFDNLITEKAYLKNLEGAYYD